MARDRDQDVCSVLLGTFSRQGASGTVRAIAQAKAAISCAMATTTWLTCFPRAVSWRYRLQRRTCAFQLMAWTSAGSFSSRSWRWRLTFAGYRYAHAPSTSARRAWLFPALVIPPCRRRSPDEYSEGVRRSEEHTSELQSHSDLVCRLLLEKKK